MNKWDLYDEKFNKTNEVINEIDEIPNGRYHYTVNIYIINSKKQVLLVRSSLNYNLHYPGFWQTIVGSVKSGEEILTTCIESCKNKIGISFNQEDFKKIDTCLRDPYGYIYETYIVEKDLNLDDIKFADKTMVQAKWIDINEIYNMISNGEIAWVLIPRIEKYILPYLK